MLIYSILLQEPTVTFFEKLIEVASHITNPISLVAFAIALIPAYFIYINISDRNALKNNPQEYIRISERIQVDLKDVKEEERPAIIKQMLRGRITAQIIFSVSIIIGGIILAWVVKDYINPNVTNKKPDSTIIIRSAAISSPEKDRLREALGDLTKQGEKIKTNILLKKRDAYEKDDCDWVSNLGKTVEKYIEQTNDRELVPYLDRIDAINCGSSHESFILGLEESPNSTPEENAKIRELFDKRRNDCLKTVERQLQVLNDIKINVLF